MLQPFMSPTGGAIVPGSTLMSAQQRQEVVQSFSVMRNESWTSTGGGGGAPGFGGMVAAEPAASALGWLAHTDAVVSNDAI